MAPEVIKGEGAGFASDVWSLGCTIYEMITAKILFGSLEPMAAIFHIGNLTATPEPPPALSSAGQSFFRRCMAVSSSARPTAKELLCDPFLHSAAASVPAGISLAATETPRPP